jgi:sugar/nucleoside kinase (ribokinase family)
LQLAVNFDLKWKSILNAWLSIKLKRKKVAHILVVGSLAYDTVKTPSGKVDGALGGSANYFGLAASLFAPVRVVGVVGEDYREEDTNLLKARGVDVSGIERVTGKTFHWAGEYGADLSEAKTLRTELNVFEHFHPKLPEAFKKSEVVFLANIDPVLQMEVLNQVSSPKLIAADTMNFWIQSKVEDLKKILAKLDILLINEGEAKLLSDAPNAVLAAKAISKMGPKHIVIKRGEYGVLMYSGEQYFALPAFPIGDVVDPTGAGDTFAGGFLGHLSQVKGPVDFAALKQAAIYGTLLASFTVQDFSVGSLRKLTLADVESRHKDFGRVTKV